MFVCNRMHRTVWRSVGKGANSFPSKSNSRHLRASGNVLMKEQGSDALARMAPEVLNHLPSRNEKFYSNMTRGKHVLTAKAEMRSIKCKLNLNLHQGKTPDPQLNSKDKTARLQDSNLIQIQVCQEKYA